MNRLILIMMLVCTISGWQTASGQQQKLMYEVFHNDRPVGRMSVIRTGNEQNFTIRQAFNADIDLFIKQVVIQGQEEANFEKGQLKHSSIYRKVNGKVKVNKRTKQTDSGYLSFNGTAWHPIKALDIRSNLLSILFYEPANNQRVFSDNLEADSKVREISSHIYQIQLSNGSLNTYSFQAGICTEIKLVSRYATLTLKRI